MPPSPPLPDPITAAWPDAFAVVIGLGVVTWLGGPVVVWFLRPFTRELNGQAGEGPTQPRGFAQGGAYIGYLERLLIYLFVLGDSFGAVGFLVAAKSIFRFGELSDHQNRLEAEYITIGTLLSFAWGLATSMLVRLVLALV